MIVKSLLVTSMMLACCMAAITVVKTYGGNPVQLDLGPHVKTWTRSIEAGKQFLKACEETDKSEKCTRWSDEKGNVIPTSAESRAFNNGSLIVYSFLRWDKGEYSSPDDKKSDPTVFKLELKPITIQLTAHRRGE